MVNILFMHSELYRLPVEGWSHEDQQVQESPLFNELLLQWCSTIPNFRILDLAAGSGFEANYLAKMTGGEITAQDSNSEVWDKVYPVRYGTVDKLNYPRRHFGRVLLKDTLVFLNPEERARMMKEVTKVVSNGGSFLIASQMGSSHIAYVMEGSNVWSVPSIDFNNEDDWADYVTNQVVYGGLRLISIEYKSTPDDLIFLAQQSGLRVNSYFIYDHSDALARENRWIHKSGFVIDLRK